MDTRGLNEYSRSCSPVRLGLKIRPVVTISLKASGGIPLARVHRDHRSKGNGPHVVWKVPREHAEWVAGHTCRMYRGVSMGGGRCTGG
uniref:ORF3 protein n=1 Tax=Fowl adenovirus A serotype 1 (strain CELO / Phelps) TaxID=10553 RepID=Q64775_ADEG1|nr:ORF3 [Fowl aviadenovirus 1]